GVEIGSDLQAEVENCVDRGVDGQAVQMDRVAGMESLCEVDLIGELVARRVAVQEVGDIGDVNAESGIEISQRGGEHAGEVLHGGETWPGRRATGRLVAERLQHTLIKGIQRVDDVLQAAGDERHVEARGAEQRAELVFEAPNLREQVLRVQAQEVLEGAARLAWIVADVERKVVRADIRPSEAHVRVSQGDRDIESRHDDRYAKGGVKHHVGGAGAVELERD